MYPVLAGAGQRCEPAVAAPAASVTTATLAGLTATRKLPGAPASGTGTGPAKLPLTPPPALRIVYCFWNVLPVKDALTVAPPSVAAPVTLVRSAAEERWVTVSLASRV